jgi:hypothetical protein
MVLIGLKLNHLACAPESMVGKFGNPPNTSDPIQFSSSPSDHKNPHKKLKEGSTRDSKPAKEIDSEPIMPNLPQETTVTPSPKICISSTKCDIPSTSTIETFPSSTLKSAQPPTIEQLQQENAQLT